MEPTKRPRNLRRAPLNHEPAHLAFLLKDRGGQAAAARAIGKAPSVVNEYVKGTRSMPQDVLLELADYLGCPPSLLERRVRPAYSQDAA
jgi:hypothetical protein